MPDLGFLFYPLIGAFVGAFTNAVAIRLLFRPRRRVLGVQGLLPKRKGEIAKRAGEIVNGYLVNGEAIRRKIDGRKLDEAVERFIAGNAHFLLAVPFATKIAKKAVLSALIDKDGYFKKSVIESFIDEETVSAIVEQKINELELDDLEKLMKKASGPELRFIVLSGGILGFLVGALEAFVSRAWR